MEKIYIDDTDTLEAMGLDDAFSYHAPATGVWIKNVYEGFDAAEKLQVEDIIISANGISCKDMYSLQELIYDSRVGDKLELEVFRDGKIINISVELGYSSSME